MGIFSAISLLFSTPNYTLIQYTVDNRPNQFIAFDESFSGQPILGKKEEKFMAFIRLEGFRLLFALCVIQCLGYWLWIDINANDTTVLLYVELIAEEDFQMHTEQSGAVK